MNSEEKSNTGIVESSEYSNLGVKPQIDSDNNNEEKTHLILSSQHKLNANWVFWYISRKEKDHNVPYEERLKKIVTFNTLEDFFRYYVYLKSASEVERNSDLSIFKEGYKPLWESCPDGGCWFIRFKKSDDPSEIDLKWEKLLFALIGEQFEEPNMLGAVLSIRGRETIIELWFNYLKNAAVKVMTLEKMKELLDIDTSMTVYFKDNENAMKDKSTLKNAETYNNTQRKKSNYH
jgi:translation initiation factor 4E